ncbi:hypothetical protein GE061_004145 [Apolygus lucorum]|uniref:Peptidase C1A papain C-terminal domain-containing protein n=1 Tax=Apolygus lucorum TaxID=248454 RepID=A0A8S9WXU4_APOLU|nr:hypothetical protein GE061_004145 [Apolygus lucorum]
MKELWILVCFVSTSHGLSCTGLSPPVWPKAYSVRGNISVPMAEVEEPFMAFYDETSGNSRIDYWGGNFKSYQSSAQPFGFLRRVTYFVKESLLYQLCVQRNGTAAESVEPQTVLPDLSMYTCADVNEKDGIQTQKWSYFKTNYISTTKLTMWLSMELISGASVPSPLRFEIKEFDGILGSVTDHYFLIYDLFSSEPPPAHVWKLDSLVTCSNFRNERVKEMSRFNPIREYILNSDDYVNEAWEIHLRMYNKTYHGLEQLIRRQIFKQNRRFVFSRNRRLNEYKLKVNRFADWSQQELDSLRGRKFLPGGNNASVFPEELMYKDIPTHLDWRKRGFDVPVKDQGMCGNGWAFASAGVLEGANFIRTGTSVDMSVQALMDCTWNYGNEGCDGGDDFRTFQWVKHSGGGVYSDPACLSRQEDLDHYALLTGYGSLNGKDYWIVKNSWSSSWGLDGYILIAVDDNLCGVMTNPTYVIT